MKTLNAVKTEEEAIAALQSWILENTNDETMQADTYIDDTDTRCACGQTAGKIAWFEACELMAAVAICDVCGE